MTEKVSVEDTLINHSDTTCRKYYIPKNLPSFLLTDLVQYDMHGGDKGSAVQAEVSCRAASSKHLKPVRRHTTRERDW